MRFLTKFLCKSVKETNYGTVYEGRYVNIHSFDFKSNSYWQDTSETFSTSSNNNKLYFNIKVNYFDLNGNTTLAISVMNNQNAVFSQTYTQSNPPPSNIIKVYGDQMSVDYNTYGNYTKGFQIDLKTVENEDVSPGTPASPSPSSSSASSSSSSSIFTSPTVPTSFRFTRISSEPTSSSKLSTNPSTSSRSPDVSTTLGVETTTKTKLRTFSVFCLLPLFIAALN
uniref:CUB domain-containing protein n=1 Tax=Caenorhabditis japonica TaxID=281687 RepID=A0A8R1EAZ0_CAEJA